MKDAGPKDDLTGDLALLLRNPALPARARQKADRLLQRLGTPVRIIILGPRPDQNAALLASLVPYMTAQDIYLELGDWPMTATTLRGIDSVIWATETFGADEAAIWEAAPDALKDHSFLAVCDPPNATLVAELADRTPDDFLGCCAVPMAQGELAPQTLADELRSLVARGQQADHDNALIFLESNKGFLPRAGEIFPPLTTAADAPPSPPPTAASPAPLPTPVPLPDKDRTAQGPAVTVPSPAPDHMPISRAADPDTPQGLFENAFAFLQDRAMALAGVSLSDASAGPAAVLDICAAASEHLADLVTAEPPSDETAEFRDDVLLAADNLVLMRLEDDTRSATDAVTTLLQLQKELATRLAA